ncbi:transposase [Saliterribacillus persicus]|uniref:Transposase n=1 Tax=Saliterribacillus persicus TaxID=930114 RepID=A0A368Y849_9BACI|nr:transposase [Saliterribacillus persicus]RCW75007.1 hypothetical protein DFR57_103305 [Saliterribacillus persicus]
MSQKRRKFTTEFKKQVVALYDNGKTRDSDGVIIVNQFNGLMVRSYHRGNVREKIERYENLTIKIHVKENCSVEGHIEINVFDIEHNDFAYKSPLIKIENGKIINESELTYQYLR